MLLKINNNPFVPLCKQYLMGSRTTDPVPFYSGDTDNLDFVTSPVCLSCVCKRSDTRWRVCGLCSSPVDVLNTQTSFCQELRSFTPKAKDHESEWIKSDVCKNLKSTPNICYKKDSSVIWRKCLFFVTLGARSLSLIRFADIRKKDDVEKVMSRYPETERNNCYSSSLPLLFMQLVRLGCMCCYIIGCLQWLHPITESKPKSHCDWCQYWQSDFVKIKTWFLNLLTPTIC